MADIKQIMDDIYVSMSNNNENMDAYIETLKAALKESGEKSVEADATRLYQNNRQGRKLMQSYFKKRGVTVTFGTAE
ncbi:MAG: hypothetical protein JWM96_918 [Alphaproteobacteria bacterium]|nr:hypothetical protein [Alphaproteobacteria bacterium]